MIQALLKSGYFVLIGLYICFWPALAIGLLAHLLIPEWEVIVFVVVYSRLLTDFLFSRKGNWLS